MGYNHPAESKTVIALHPKDYAATKPTTSELVVVDTKGFRFARLDVVVGTVAGTSFTGVVQEDDNSGFTSGTTITGASLPPITTSNDVQVHSVTVDMAKRERYLRLDFTFTAMTATPLAASCTLWGPDDATNLGSEVNASV